MTADLDSVPPDMRLELEKFDQEAEKIIASFVGTIEASPPPSTIYHYTNDVGLRGIIETGKIWLTDIFNLNDPSELSHGFSHAVKILNSKAVDGHPSSKLFSQEFEKFLTQGGIPAVAHFFVCSFSSTGDDLGQWRAYADNGRGYALGFDVKELENAFTREGDMSNNHTFPITYNDGKLVELHMQLVERMLHLLPLPHDRGLSPEVILEYNIELCASLSMHALRSAALLQA